ncbi:Helix-turn-helix [Pedobacter suwonensis]|uniref:Helix-turn-helix n=1 Tax=Pedobacter suwonensis TaxID=332999 RepID=A0A1I0SQ67_9SPHI|nr:helix-turn-helix transcriptional regulator [Pedobacter suwonensis]SFA41557.1 Helix-turn-helix [Pedobacter suwonensis]
MKNLLSLRATNVAVNIRRVREYRGYTQHYLADKLKITQNAYSKIELGYSELTVGRLFQIAEILNAEPVSLLTLSHRDLINVITHAKKKL